MGASQVRGRPGHHAARPHSPSAPLSPPPPSLRILNAGEASFGPAGFSGGYSAVATYDRHHWFRVTGDVGSTTYDPGSGVLEINHTPTRDAVYYAYWAPYTLERHQKLVAETQAQDGVRLAMVGETLDGHDLDQAARIAKDMGNLRRERGDMIEHPFEI